MYNYLHKNYKAKVIYAAKFFPIVLLVIPILLYSLLKISSFFIVLFSLSSANIRINDVSGSLTTSLKNFTTLTSFLFISSTPLIIYFLSFISSSVSGTFTQMFSSKDNGSNGSSFVKY